MENMKTNANSCFRIGNSSQRGITFSLPIIRIHRKPYKFRRPRYHGIKWPFSHFILALCLASVACVITKSTIYDAHMAINDASLHDVSQQMMHDDTTPRYTEQYHNRSLDQYWTVIMRQIMNGFSFLAADV